MTALVCTRCGKKLSRKHARMIEGKPMHAGCMFGNAKVDGRPKGRDGLPGSGSADQRGDAGTAAFAQPFSGNPSK